MTDIDTLYKCKKNLEQAKDELSYQMNLWFKTVENLHSYSFSIKVYITEAYIIGKLYSLQIKEMDLVISLLGNYINALVEHDVQEKWSFRKTIECDNGEGGKYIDPARDIKFQR